MTTKEEIERMAEEKLGIVPYLRNELIRYSGEGWGEIAAFKKGYLAAQSKTKELVEKAIGMAREREFNTIDHGKPIYTKDQILTELGLQPNKEQGKQ